ncbi:MAG: SPOR domain-containing protein [Cytophagaceae bacterium]|nr:SPOR domain-containing protein [Cytophagaceae bacterium]
MKNNDQKTTNNFNDQNAEAEKVLNEIIENNKKNISGRGFRIQVFSGNNKEDFENAKSFLLRNFEELEIYESYSQPTYLIKVGDFIQYSDAERFQKDLKGRFNTTRIVGDKINLKKALNIK